MPPRPPERPGTPTRRRARRFEPAPGSRPSRAVDTSRIRRSPGRTIPTDATGLDLPSTAGSASSASRRGRGSTRGSVGGQVLPSARSGRKRESGAEAELRASLDRSFDQACQQESPDGASFAELGVPPLVVTALARTGITQPFAIQVRALPDALAGRDVLGRAQTGSGKTLAFVVPMLSRLASAASTMHQERLRGQTGVDSAAHRPGRRPGAPNGLVLVPTRELALQVADVCAPLAAAVGLRVTTIFGGAPYSRQLSALTRGVDVVIATPGRLVDLIERGACRLDEVEVCVLDEADYMADLGFLPVVTSLLEQTRPDGQRLLFSATLDRGVATLVQRFLTDPAVHAVAAASAPVAEAEHLVFSLSREHKVPVAVEVAGRPGRTLFFVRTKHGADRLATQLDRAGVPAEAIHGNRSQGQRQRALTAFASGRSRVLVATDVAARGIHVDDVDLVVHFDPPADHKDYLHRSGRTARAGASGTVVALAQPDQLSELARLHRSAHVEPTVLAVHPGHDAVRDLATSGEPVVVVEPPAAARRAAGRGRRGPDGGPDGTSRRGADRPGARSRDDRESGHRPGQASQGDVPSLARARRSRPVDGNAGPRGGGFREAKGSRTGGAAHFSLRHGLG